MNYITSFQVLLLSITDKQTTPPEKVLLTENFFYKTEYEKIWSCFKQNYYGDHTDDEA